MTRQAAVLGSPIAHSLSPTLHRAAYQRLGLGDWRYAAVEVDEAALPAFLAGLDASWAGLSLTMPLKRAVIPLLAQVSEVATSVRAVNTVLPADGGWRGENTDVPGMVAALAERGVRRVASAAVLGGGATAASAIAALATVSDEVVVYARGPERAAQARACGERVGVAVRPVEWEHAERALTAPLVVSTVPAGGADPLAALVRRAGGVGALFDVVYHPWPTPLAAAWEQAGGLVLSGLDLLVHQAALQVRLMTGLAAPLAAMRAAGERELAARAAG